MKLRGDSLYFILTDDPLHGVIIDVGIPFLRRNCRYDARAIILKLARYSAYG